MAPPTGPQARCEVEEGPHLGGSAAGLRRIRIVPLHLGDYNRCRHPRLRLHRFALVHPGADPTIRARPILVFGR